MHADGVLPSPEEIRIMCEAIRKTWSDTESRKRVYAIDVLPFDYPAERLCVECGRPTGYGLTRYVGDAEFRLCLDCFDYDRTWERGGRVSRPHANPAIDQQDFQYHGSLPVQAGHDYWGIDL